VISVIDTERATVSRRIDTPTPLLGGGYLVAIQPGVVPTDTSAHGSTGSVRAALPVRRGSRSRTTR